MALAFVLARPAQAGDWTFYRHDLAGTANAGEPLTTDQARALEVNRALFAGGDANCPGRNAQARIAQFDSTSHFHQIRSQPHSAVGAGLCENQNSPICRLTDAPIPESPVSLRARKRGY